MDFGKNNSDLDHLNVFCNQFEILMTIFLRVQDYTRATTRFCRTSKWLLGDIAIGTSNSSYTCTRQNPPLYGLQLVVRDFTSL